MRNRTLLDECLASFAPRRQLVRLYSCAAPIKLAALAALAVVSVMACWSSNGDADGPAIEVARSHPTHGDGGGAERAGAAITTPNETAGSRLKPQYLKFEGADGSITLRTWLWWDDERGETCAIQTLSDGKKHCAPYGEEPMLAFDSHFEDAACTLPVLVLPTGDPSKYGADCAFPERVETNRYVRIAPSNARYTCAAPRLAHVPTTKRVSLKTAYRKGPTGACTPAPIEDSAHETFSLDAPLEEIDPAAFVTVTTSDDTPATAFRLRASREIWTGSDASRSVSEDRVVDAHRNEMCDDHEAQDGVHRCLPSAAPIRASGFSDAACEVPAYSVADDESCAGDARRAPRRYLAAIENVDCERTQIHPWFTSSNELTHRYERGTTGCVGYALTANPDDGLFDFAGPLPPPIPPSSFAPVETVLEDTPAGWYGIAGQRLTPRHTVVRADGLATSSLPWPFDTEMNTTCRPTTLQDGRTYCVGEIPSLSLSFADAHFADAGCTRQVVGIDYAPPSSCGGAPKAVPELAMDRPYAAHGCSAHRVFALPAPLQPATTLYGRSPSGTCEPSQTIASEHVLFDATAVSEVLPSTFVAMTVSYVH